MNFEHFQPSADLPLAQAFASLRKKIVSVSEDFVAGSMDYPTFRVYASTIHEEVKSLQEMMKTMRLIERCGAQREKHRQRATKKGAKAA